MSRVLCGLTVLLLALGPRDGVAQSIPAAWGTPVDGLRLGVAVDDIGGPEPRIEVTFENTGAQDALLNIGSMLGNGRTLVPNAVGLRVTGPSFGMCVLEYADQRVGGVAGRLDDLVVGLPSGSSYTVRLSLRDFWCVARKQFPMQWPGERLQVSARFEGRDARSVNLDMPGMRLMQFWRGKLSSGPVDVTLQRPLRKRPSARAPR